LPSLRRIDTRQADFVLNPVGIEHPDRIAIGDDHHFAVNVCNHRGGKAEQQEDDKSVHCQSLPSAKLECLIVSSVAATRKGCQRAIVSSFNPVCADP
jgi:hypothetical protein